LVENQKHRIVKPRSGRNIKIHVSEIGYEVWNWMEGFQDGGDVDCQLLLADV
jgi:hypothetical protein